MTDFMMEQKHVSRKVFNAFIDRMLEKENQKYINQGSEYRTDMSSTYGQTLNIKQIPVNSGSSGSGSGNSAKQYDTIWYAIG